MDQDRARPLSTVKTGQKVRLSSIKAGRGLNSRLASMGLVANVEITVVSDGHPGPFVVIVKDSRIMLGKGIARKILVFS